MTRRRRAPKPITSTSKAPLPPTPPKEEFQNLPSPEDLCLTWPLYEQIKLDRDFHKLAYGRMRGFQGHFDCYCSGCQRHSTFHSKNPIAVSYDGSRYCNETYAIHFECTRNEEHTLKFIFQLEQNILTKIGQFPSLADLAKGDIEKYRKPLGSARFRELSKAIGLAAHGAGIGGFIYLRRIFESLIAEAYEIAKDSENWDEQAYQDGRTQEKIKLLTRELPDFLVKNRKLYGIMSKAVHSLSEEECLQTFPIVRIAIELILDQKIEEINKAEKHAIIAKQLTDLADNTR